MNGEVMLQDNVHIRSSLDQSIDGYNLARVEHRRVEASRHILNLYSTLSPFYDDTFRQSWDAIKAGRLTDLLERDRRVRFQELEQAKVALMGLMDRVGLGLAKDKSSRLEAEEEATVAELRRFIRTGEWPTTEAQA